MNSISYLEHETGRGISHNERTVQRKRNKLNHQSIKRNIQRQPRIKPLNNFY